MVEEDGPGSNPFGLVDHSAFAAFGAELVYGIRPDGSLVHVSSVPRGLACQCSCPACGGTLIARRGDFNIPHFGHHAKGGGCGYNPETNAHSWAKEVLGRELRLLLPSVAAMVGRRRLQTYDERVFTFTHAELEKFMGDIVPDVVLTAPDGRKLLVEVLVTHACGPEKIEKLQERGIAALQIDMSAWRKSSDRREIERALIDGAPREWLFNPKVEEAKERLQAQIARHAVAEEAMRRRAAERLAATSRAEEARARRALDAETRKFEVALQRARHSTTGAGFDELQGVRADAQLAPLLLPSAFTDGFTVPSTRWQAALLIRRVQVEIGDEFHLPNFDLDAAVRSISDCIGEPFEMEVPEHVARALRSRGLVGKLPRDAIEDYLQYLCDQYILQRDGGGGFEVADDRAESLAKQQEQWLVRKRRRKTVDQALDTILSLIPPDEQGAFDRSQWETRNIPDLGRSLHAFLKAPQARWQELRDALQAIERMMQDGAPARTLLGLPVEGALRRARNRERSRAQGEADARERTLSIAAFDALEEAARDWLYTPPDADAPIVLARNSQAGLDAALHNLADEARRRKMEAAANLLAAECRRELKMAAEKGLGATKSRFFLHNYDASLRARPWDVAISKAGLASALAELAAWIKREKRSKR
ncbi:hypothetical protein [Sphingomonas sp.]|uniref:hypothetical protein n=1 Tax=Sphingomonas sp. TaxID=28214 RepID=UPI002FDB18B0